MGARKSVVVEVVDGADPIMDKVEHVAHGFVAVAGNQAFRNYDWLHDVAVKNVSGNLRGMVVSARWNTAYRVVSKSADVVGTAAMVTSIAVNVVDTAPQFEAIYKSQDEDMTKAAHYSGLASTVMQRTLAGIVTGPVDLFYKSMVVNCDAAANAGLGPNATSAAKACSDVMKNASTLMTNTVMYVTDPTNQQQVLQTLIDIAID